MDYGHTSQSAGSSAQPFFTAGAGTNSTSVNNFEAENNLDTSSKEGAHWNNNLPNNRDPRNIGNIGNLGVRYQEDIKKPDLIPNLTNKSPELGKVINLEMPPNSSQTVNKVDVGVSSEENGAIAKISSYHADIKTTGEGLNKSGIMALRKAAEKELNEKDNPADFVEAIRNEEYGIAPTFFSNSYGENSAWKKAA